MKENVYKVGMTQKENHERFKGYPKGFILLFQMICNNCKNMEKKVIKLFKENFKLRKELGNEYFEGEYKNMINLIYSTIQNEKDECEGLEQQPEEDKGDALEKQSIEDEGEALEKQSTEDEGDALEKQSEDEPEVYEIQTYEEWIKYNDISKIIITTKNGKGFLKFKDQPWHLLSDLYGEDLFGYINHNLPCVQRMIVPENKLVSTSEKCNLVYQHKHKVTNSIITFDAFNELSVQDKKNYESIINNTYKYIQVEYNIDKIYQDTLIKCYDKKCEFYNLNYNEYVVCDVTGPRKTMYVGFNSLNFTFTPFDKFINNKILTNDDCGEGFLYVKNVVDVDIVNNILNSLIKNEIKLQYKKLVYNLIVRQEEELNIFYDYNNCLLTEWITNTLYKLSGHKFYVNSRDYYDNKTEFRTLWKKQKPRCVIIRITRDDKRSKQIAIEKQIKDFIKLGFRNIIVCQHDKTNNMYNIANFRKYLTDNKELLMKCIKEENSNYKPTDSETDIKFDDDVFYKPCMFLTNFLKWGCFK